MSHMISLKMDCNTLDCLQLAVSNLREDVVIESSAMEKQIILENFPNKKNGFLVVAKVIEG